MEPKREHDEVRSRNENFTDRTSTKIWQEDASADNPYIASAAFCYGYDLVELMQKRSFSDVFYLLFRGELPSAEESELLEKLMIGLINPGPRHPATRAAMNTGVGKTDPVHILPIAASVMGGKHLGAGNIEETMRFFRKQQKHQPSDVIEKLEVTAESVSENSECTQLPGFGRLFGGVDLLSYKIAQELSQLDGAGKILKWGVELAEVLRPMGIGWFAPSVAAAVFADLGFQPRAGASLYQLICAPGLVAHGLELVNKPITAMPFVKDENYVIQKP